MSGRLQSMLSNRAATAIREALGVDADPDLRATTDARFGDYQINGVLPLAKQLTSAALCASPSRSLSSLSGRCAARGQRIGRRSGGSRCAESTSPHTHTRTRHAHPHAVRTVRSEPCCADGQWRTVCGISLTW